MKIQSRRHGGERSYALLRGKGMTITMMKSLDLVGLVSPLGLVPGHAVAPFFFFFFFFFFSFPCLSIFPFFLQAGRQTIRAIGSIRQSSSSSSPFFFSFFSITRLSTAWKEKEGKNPVSRCA